jgi:hypothetical protein
VIVALLQVRSGCTYVISGNSCEPLFLLLILELGKNMQANILVRRVKTRWRLEVTLRRIL